MQPSTSAYSCPNATFRFTPEYTRVDWEQAGEGLPNEVPLAQCALERQCLSRTPRGPRDDIVNVTVQAAGLKMCPGNEDVPLPVASESEAGVCVSL